jgi:hypothetical protein
VLGAGLLLELVATAAAPPLTFAAPSFTSGNRASRAPCRTSGHHRNHHYSVLPYYRNTMR